MTMTSGLVLVAQAQAKTYISPHYTCSSGALTGHCGCGLDHEKYEPALYKPADTGKPVRAQILGNQMSSGGLNLNRY